MSEGVDCPHCGKEMKYLGNIDDKLLCSIPLKWYETYVCHECKIKKTFPCSGGSIENIEWVKNYKEEK